MTTTSVSVELKDEQVVDADVVYNISGTHIPASMEGPEEWPECEVEHITLCGLDITGILKTPMETIEEACFENSASIAEASYEAYCDSREER